MKLKLNIVIIIVILIQICGLIFLNNDYKLKIKNLEDSIHKQEIYITQLEEKNNSLNKSIDSMYKEVNLYKEKNKLANLQLKLASGVLEERIRVEDLRVQVNLPSEWFDNFFENSPLEGLGNAITIAERQYGVNALFIASVAVYESGYGTSQIAQDKNNLFGFTAYDNSPYKSAATFSNFEQSIDKFAELISTNYLKKDGEYFSGYTIEDINVRYATDKEWSKGVKKVINKILSRNICIK
jgi:beta-N-acetylglucosaminidase